MLEVVYFTLAAIALYVVADWILERVESALGRRLEYRSLLFFVILLVLAMSSFALIRQINP